MQKLSCIRNLISFDQQSRSAFWVFLCFCSSNLAWSADGFSLAAEFADSIVRAERKLLEGVESPTPQDIVAINDFVAGALQHAWTLSSNSRQLHKPRFVHNTELVGMPGLVNPDTHYSSALIEDHGAYTLRGVRGAASHVTLQFIDSYPMIGLSKDLLVIDLDNIGIERGEQFELRFGGSPALDHWWPLPPGSQAVLARQTFSDWRVGTLTSLQILRTDEPVMLNSADSLPRLKLAARYLEQIVELWAERYMAGLRRLPLNVFPPVRASENEDGGLSGQYGVIARFRITANEAIVVRVRRSDARYQSIQVGNRWFVTPDYEKQQSSLNQNQATSSGGSHYFFVISHNDPGVANWLQAARGSEGYVMIRWQSVATPLSELDQPTMELVETEKLLDRLPADIEMVSADDRQNQLEARRNLPALKQ